MKEHQEKVGGKYLIISLFLGLICNKEYKGINEVQEPSKIIELDIYIYVNVSIIYSYLHRGQLHMQL